MSEIAPEWPPAAPTLSSPLGSEVAEAVKASRVRVVGQGHAAIVVDEGLTVTREWTPVPADKMSIVRMTAGRGSVRIEVEEADG